MFSPENNICSCLFCFSWRIKNLYQVCIRIFQLKVVLLDITYQFIKEHLRFAVFCVCCANKYNIQHGNHHMIFSYLLLSSQIAKFTALISKLFQVCKSPRSYPANSGQTIPQMVSWGIHRSRPMGGIWGKHQILKICLTNTLADLFLQL